MIRRARRTSSRRRCCAAWRHPEVADDAERSARAWLFTVARNLIIDERRSARYRHESGTADVEAVADRAGPDDVDNALDKLLLGTALSQLSDDHRAVVVRAYYQGWSVAPDRGRSSDRRGNGEVPAALRGPGASAQFAGDGGDAMTQSGGPRGLDPADGDRYATWDAAYVLGALSSSERREFEAHLQHCERCSAAVAELGGMPALLGLLDAEDVRGLEDAQTDPPPLRPEVLQTVLDRVRWRRRRSAVVPVGSGRVGRRDARGRVVGRGAA